jgi:hypothetical protein
VKTPRCLRVAYLYFLVRTLSLRGLTQRLACDLPNNELLRSRLEGQSSTIEEVLGDLDQTELTGVIVAAAIAAAIERIVLGEHPVFAIPAGYGLHHTE